jgi:plastocyanin
MVVLLSTAAGLVAAGRREPTSREVVVKAVTFTPGTLRAHVGDTVVWRNADIVSHTVEHPGLFSSGDIASGERYRWVPTDTGVVRYRCTIHERMRGEIAVDP